MGFLGGKRLVMAGRQRFPRVARDVIPNKAGKDVGVVAGGRREV